MNHQFVLRYKALQDWRAVKLASGLGEIVDAGFVERDDCVLLGYFAEGATNATVSGLHDKTGYEAFLNHVHIEDYATSEINRNALSFAAKVLAKWQEESRHGELNAIVALNEEGAAVRFHVRRSGEFWLAQDLDAYGEAILALSSGDLAFLDVF